jgi:hypothetical protein
MFKRLLITSFSITFVIHGHTSEPLNHRPTPNLAQ